MSHGNITFLFFVRSCKHRLKIQILGVSTEAKATNCFILFVNVCKCSLPLFKYAVCLEEMKCLFMCPSENKQHKKSKFQTTLTWTFLIFFCTLDAKSEGQESERKLMLTVAVPAVPRWVWWMTAGVGVVKPASTSGGATQRGGNSFRR